MTERSTARPWLSLIVLCLGTFAILLDTTIVNVAIPSLITDLHASLDQAVWVVNSYLLVFTALLIVASRLGDIFGPRRLFVGGLAVFAVASALCGVAQTPGQLIAARVLQGVGAAALTPQGMVVIQSVFPRERMGAAFGVFSSMAGLAAVAGPTIGGVLTTYANWRWVFFVNLPIAAAGIALALIHVPDIRTGRRHRLDLVGVLLASLGLSAVVFGLIEGQRYSWAEIRDGITIPEIIGAGVVILAAFVVWERHRPEPLMPLRLFADRTFTIMVVLNVLVQFALLSMMLVNAINLQSALGMTAVRSGLTALPFTIALSGVAPFAGRLTDRFGGKFVLLTGLFVYAVGIAGVAAVNSTDATSLTFTVPLLIGGLGMGAVFAPLATEAMRAAPPGHAAAASGILNTGRQLGATLGGAVTGAVMAGRLTAAMHARAVHDSAALPATARAGFTGAFSHAAAGGLRIGPGQSIAQVPRDTPGPLVAQVRNLIEDVFTHGFATALRPTLGVSVAVLLAGAALCLLLRRGGAPVHEPVSAEPVSATAE
ncbi:DHA2 family efflux MFS transporter permease subunit [Actinoallomurus bryophytorum]|uniref:EmrB/QacA subfamily drug resistance transporter n=1 Tax=Actinoallomurus bryophytorum TaxID=1490222 RepID=A0A543C0Q0_9ACTN|nr:MFS transporter [Actinoallomurus bryophytorum]TQL90596.1 EmrB/QacA subfamily drug resistance transporter [Actinoallomurus bryophytorum]